MTARDYPCPDCEDALGPCSGFGCPAKRMERFAVMPTEPRKSVPTNAKATAEERRKRSTNKPRRLSCDECGTPYLGLPASKWCSAACRVTARKRYDRNRYAVMLKNKKL